MLKPAEGSNQCSEGSQEDDDAGIRPSVLTTAPLQRK